MKTLHEEYLKGILSARVYDVSVETRLHAAPLLSARTGNSVLLKREDEQRIFSFKCRGAFNRIHRLLESERLAGRTVVGVIAASAGNHAQGVALAAGHLGIEATIVMPVTTPSIKSDAVKALGGEVVLHGDDFDTALGHAIALGESRCFPFIHPFDHPDTIAGQGTVAVEICRQHPGPLDAVFVPVGGGGLAAGVCAYMKYLRPEVKVIGVEPVDAASMHDAKAAGDIVTLASVGLFADGVAVRRVGEATFALCKDLLDEVVLVSVDEMSAAIKDTFNETRTMVEPAGALAVAGMKRWAHDNEARGQTFVAVSSGANINFDRLRHVAERAEIGETREALFAATIPERPGSFLDFCTALGRRSITEFNYRRSEPDIAQVFAGIEVPGGRVEREALLGELGASGFEVLDMTDNDTAKLHVRHMIGGHARAEAGPGGEPIRERLYRFRFPERPGALVDFLTRIGTRGDITLFHYRNHGAAYGRVLVGLRFDAVAEAGIDEFVAELGFHGVEVSDDAACRLFLG